jgi:hypothetical protein
MKEEVKSAFRRRALGVVAGKGQTDDDAEETEEDRFPALQR